MVEMFFTGEKPAEVQNLVNKFDGTLTERYMDEKGRMIDDHHRGPKGSPLQERNIYPGGEPDLPNRETIYFEGKTGEEKPYLRRVYKNNRLAQEEGLRGSLDNVRYLEKYTYRGNEISPSTTIHEDFDEKGKSVSVFVCDKNNPFGKKVQKGGLVDQLSR